MDRYAIKVGLWVFTGQFFQLFCMFEKFHNKMLCGGEAANNLHSTVSSVRTEIFA